MMKKKRNYFEGWYFREQSGNFTVAFIPELSYDQNGHMTGSLQVVLPEKTWYYVYPHPVNMNLPDSLFVVLGKNVFTEACIHLDIEEPDLYIKGDIYFDCEPGARFHVMGPLGLPLIAKHMPCSHKIWAMEQEISGELVICGKKFSFNGGKGYMEEDRGRRFPKSYFWSQCNWFGEKPLRISCAGAELPLFGKKSSFKGGFVCIDQNGYKVKLATYRGAKVEQFSASGFSIRQGKYRFEGWKMEGNPVTLKSPREGKMEEETKEYLECAIRYKLSCDGETIFDEISNRAAYEFR